MQAQRKIDIIRFEKYMKPSGCCQACLSQAQINKDCIITCQICRSCIHQTHYGSELIQQPPQIWQCQRCRYFLQNGPSDIACDFCPNLRGIMKQYLYENRKIWLHPECAVWGYPIIFFTSKKKQGIQKQKPKNQSTFFWVRDFDSNQNPCQICKQISGYRIKCKYYSCMKSYHVTCARPQGIVRDLQSMKIQNGAGYFPVYCKQHIQLKIQDCKKRVKIYKDNEQVQKAAHFNKVANLFTVQLKNLQAAVKKCKLEQQMIKKISIETRRNIQGNDHTSFSQLQQSFSSHQSQQFLQMLQSEMIDQSLPLKPLQAIKVIEQHINRSSTNTTNVVKPAPPPIQQKPITKHRINTSKYSKLHKQIPKQHSQIISRPLMDIQPSIMAPSLNVSLVKSQQQNIRRTVPPDYNYQAMFDQF